MNRQFDKPTQTILQAFCPHQHPNVVGSMRLQGMYWPTDYDQFHQLTVGSAADAVQLLKNAIEALRSLPNVRCTEIKWCDVNMKPAVFLKRSSKQLAAELLHRGGMIKLDAVAWLDSGARYTEFSCVYEFIIRHGHLEKSPNPQQSHFESIQADIEELGRHGQWFKVIKRLAALARAQNRSTVAFDAFFRSDYGLLYSVLSDLQTLESLHGLSLRRVRIELDALITRLGGLQLRDRDLEKITRELLKGDYARAVPQLQRIVNEGAKARLEKMRAG